MNIFLNKNLYCKLKISLITNLTQHDQSYLFVGNTGCGKSTLGTLQAIRLSGKAEQYFESGVCLGEGLTSILSKVDCGGENFVLDTPGLDTVSMREMAGKEIGDALRSGGSFKILVKYYQLLKLIFLQSPTEDLHSSMFHVLISLLRRLKQAALSLVIFQL